MITAELITNGTWLAALLAILIAARCGVVRITVARPARPKNGGTT